MFDFFIIIHFIASPGEETQITIADHATAIVTGEACIELSQYVVNASAVNEIMLP
jgi:hypothetical protein